MCAYQRSTPGPCNLTCVHAYTWIYQVLGNLFGQKDADTVNTKETLDRISAITAVPESADLVVPENSAQKRTMGG
ncbi:MAG: hypothetical protein ACPIOQ_46470, partial [Promethearchaeia archaeon]